MPKTPRRHSLHSLLFALCAAAFFGAVHADPSSRVARLAFASGSASFSPGGESDWARATVNRPLVTGDRLWLDAASLAELQLNGAAIRMGAFTSVTLLDFSDRMAQLQLAQGSLHVRIWRLERDQTFEVDTPNLAISIRRPGSYRIDVDASGESTAVEVREGEADVSADGSAFLVSPGRAYRFWGTGLRDYQSVPMAAPDGFDRWARARDQRWQDSPSARYVSRDLIGYQDLDEYGSWRPVAAYGHVWTPRRVAADWAPYRDGHWAWVEPWGWTWVDAAPWGFAPAHYGRWTRIASAWCWVPGPLAAVPVYAPAVVAFVGGSNFHVYGNAPGPAAVGWFALGPGEVYRPPYAASRDYFTRLNTSNTVVNITNITNVYNNSAPRPFYVNQQVPGAVIAVPAITFVQSRPVAREAMRVTRDVAVAAAVVATAPFAPVRASLFGATAGPGAPASARPPEAVQERPVLSRHAPPPAVAFAPPQAAPALPPTAGPAPLPAAPVPAAVAPPARLEAARRAPESLRAHGNAESSSHNLARREGQAERRPLAPSPAIRPTEPPRLAPPVAVRPPEPPTPAPAPPPPAAAQARPIAPSLPLVVQAAPFPAPVPAAAPTVQGHRPEAARGAQGERGRHGQKGEERRNSEEGPERRR